jgi:imidazolonepropionase-like amidohydrolase
MLRSVFRGLAHALLLSGAVAAFGAPASDRIVLEVGRGLDGRGAVLSNVAVEIEGGRIAAVTPRRGSVAGAGRIYDLSRLTVLPGLIDVHDHLVWHFTRKQRLHTDGDGEAPGEAALAAAANAYATLASGVTTAQSPGSREDAALREAIAAGLPGPRLLTSLEPLDADSGGPAALEKAVKERKAQGADLVKIFASKSIRDGGGPTMSQEQLDAACGEARRVGLRTLVHAHSSEACTSTRSAA